MFRSPTDSTTSANSRIHILTGDPLPFKPPKSYYILNDAGDSDDGGNFVIPDRWTDSQTQKRHIPALMERYPQLRAVFSDKNEQTTATVRNQFNTLQDVMQGTEDLLNNHIKSLEHKQIAQIKALRAFVSHIKSEVTKYEKHLDDFQHTLTDLKSHAQKLPDPEDIKKGFGVITTDEQGGYSALDSHIDRGQLEISIKYMDRFVSEENGEIKSGMDAAEKKFHLIKNKITAVEQNHHYSKATDLESDLYNYSAHQSRVQKLLEDRRAMVRSFQQELRRLESIDQPEEFRSQYTELTSRDWLHELQINDRELLDIQRKCEDKKAEFNEHISQCVRSLVAIYSDLRQDLNDPSIPERFQKAQASLKYITFASNLKQVYSSSMTEMTRRVDEFGEDIRTRIAAFNEEIESKVHTENKKRKEFLEEQKQLLGGYDVPSSLIPGITSLVEIPHFNPDIDEETNMETLRENQEFCEGWSIVIGNDPFERSSGKKADTSLPSSMQQNSSSEASTSSPGRSSADVAMIQELKAELASVQKQLRQRDATLSEKDSANERLREQLKQSREFASELRSEREAAEKKITELHREISDMKNQKRTLESKVEDLTDDLTQAKAEITVLHGNLKTAASAHKETFQKQLNDRVNALSGELREARKEAEVAHKQFTQQKEENDLLRGEKSRLSNDMVKANEEIEKLHRDLDTRKKSYNQQHKEWYQENENLKQELHNANMKARESSMKLEEAKEQVKKIAQVVAITNEANDDLKDQLRKKDAEIKNLQQQEKTTSSPQQESSTSQVEEKLRKEVSDLKILVQEKDHQLTHMEQRVRRSARAVDTFKEAIRKSLSQELYRVEKKHGQHMKEIANLKSENSSATGEILHNLRKQLEHSAQAISATIPVLSCVLRDLPEMNTLCALLSEPTSTINGVCSLIEAIANDDSRGEFLDRSVASGAQNLPRSRFALNNFKPLDNVLFFRTKEQEGLFEAVTEGDENENQYYLDPDSYSAWCSSDPKNKEKDSLCGEVIMVVKRNPNNDPLKLKRNYNTLLVEIAEDGRI